MLIATAGLTVVFLAIPFAYDALRIAGAMYLLWLAWKAVRPGSQAVFRARDLPPDSRQRLFAMGFVTNALNPKIAVFYLSIFTQFLKPEHGSVLAQSLVLGCTQIAISLTVNCLIILAASQITIWLSERPMWERAQKWLMGTVLAALGLRLAFADHS